VPRILLFTGKGGVGKTSVAAATALRAAERGTRTLVLSTDAAHSLGDVLALALGPEPAPVGGNLDAQEVDVHYSVQKHWGRLQDYIRTVFRWRGLDDVLADEMSVLPGMDEVAGFLWIDQHFESGRYDLIVIDSAPTGESLRFLSLPDVGRWWMEKFFPIHRRVARALRPAITAVSDFPVPKEETYDAAEELFHRLDVVHEHFIDPAVTSVRLVVNPEMVVIKESRRAFTYLHLFGYACDAVVLNRVLPDDSGRYFEPMRAAQQSHRALLEEAFAGLPILEAPLFPREVVGLDDLRRLGEHLYGDRDPGARLHEGKAFEIAVRGGEADLILPLPLATKEEIDLTSRDGEITVAVGPYRRTVHLPRILHGRDVVRARMIDGKLVVEFGVRRASRTDDSSARPSGSRGSARR
jgi:arsenite-transporting ATPase